MSSQISHVLGINAYGSSIRVECNQTELLDRLDHFLLPSLPRCNVPVEQGVIRLQVLYDSEAFQIIVNEAAVSSANTPEDAALAAVKALDDAMVQSLRTLRAVHAGAVVFNGRAMLFPGSSHAGKSSLVAELLSRGAEHLSDEYALIDERGQVHAYPRPLLLRKGGPKQSLVLPEELNSSFCQQSKLVRWIFAVEYEPSVRWEVHGMTQGEAVMLLLRNTPHETARCPDMVDYFVRLAAGAECYSGIRGEVSEAADRILEIVHQN